ncbi:hypothetical protein ZWY2020_008418 [Hordeum vulgare]|nr:hypothetical protein ZWY2020_008418 [Hordeum vulgare]
MPRSAISLRVPSRRRFLKTPIAPSSVNYSSAASGRPGGPCTPKLRWSFRESQEGVSEQKAPIASSVRRLGAAVWRLRPSEEAPAVERQGKSRVDLETLTIRCACPHFLVTFTCMAVYTRHLQVQLLRKHHLSHKHGLKVETSSPNSVLEQHSEELHKRKGDELDGAYVIANQLDLIEKQQGKLMLIYSTWSSSVQDRVDKLEAGGCQLKQLDGCQLRSSLTVVGETEEEKAAWWRREHKKAQSVLEDMKADLDHEKKNRRQLENINLKLIMKLVDARLTLEDKYGELCKLQQDAEAFVASLDCAKGDISILVGEAENIIREIGLVRDQEIQFKYEAPAASEILAILRAPPSHELGRCKHSEIEDGNSWETTSHQGVQGSSFSWSRMGEPSVNNVEEVWKNDMSNIKFVEHKKKQSAISKFWGHCPQKNHGIQEVEVENSLNRGNMYYYSGEAANRGMGQSSPSMEPWSSPDSMNCGFRGCMELVQRHSLKAKLLEARMETRRSSSAACSTRQPEPANAYALVTCSFI